MNKGGQTEGERRVVEAFIKHFGDRGAALRALREYRVEAKKAASEPTTPVLIDINNLSKTYKLHKQKVAALNDVSLKIHEGEFIAITGPSGSGKSTLLQLMGGLDKPSAGSININGTDINKLRDGKLSEFRNKTIGFVFQFFYLQPFLSLATNIEVPAMFAHSKKVDRKDEALKLIDEVGLTERAKHLPKELSGGQMQRAAIARAMMNKPKIILADEPTGNLDSKNGAGIIDIFENIRKEFGTTIVIVTHDSSIAARADREIAMSDGVIV